MKPRHYLFLPMLLIVVIFAFGCSPKKVIKDEKAQEPQIAEEKAEGQISEEPETQQTAPEEETEVAVAEETIPKESEQIKEVMQVPVWKQGGAAIPGKYADAEIIELANGNYRMYYSAEPEVPGFKGQVYSAISSDGINWNEESGERMQWATFPSVIKLPNGKFRMYFQNQGKIKSAASADGLSWNEESGVRVDASNDEGLRLENVAAPTVAKAGDEYVMVYRGTINERYPAKVPNDNIQLFLWAISKDGLAFEKKGIALDSRNEEFQGLLDGPEFAEWGDGEARLYFWSYRGIYHITYRDGIFSQDAVFDYTTSDNPLNRFPENPPGDPTLAKINGKWLMYHGQHGKGIYYATFEQQQT